MLPNFVHAVARMASGHHPVKSFLTAFMCTFIVYRLSVARGFRGRNYTTSLYFLMSSFPVAFVLGLFGDAFSFGGLVSVAISMAYLYRSYRAGEFGKRAPSRS
jgi:uncharacterized membrane protein